MPPNSVLPAWFQRAIESLQAGDIEGWMEIYAPDAIHEFPFAPDHAPRIPQGRDVIANYMSQLPSLIRFGSFTDIRAREAPGELIVEAIGHHHRIADNSPRDLSYVWFIEHRDGKVSHFRDYMNPLQLTAR